MQPLNLANKYRPQRFEDVWGQEHPVALLSGLVRRGQIGRNLLLHGAVGAGKTSLVRLYAKALNCLAPDAGGSPCNACKRCECDQRDAGLFEYDVSGRGGEKEQIRSWVDSLLLSSADHKMRTLFFDEAHAMTTEAADSLLKDIEREPKGVIFCFATTAPTKLQHALRSRLMQLEVRPLSDTTAVEFLQEIAGREGIAYENDALALLAGVKRCFPRDLLTGLEQVAEAGGRVTIDEVKRVFDVDHTDVLVEYFLALANGEFERQTELIHNWREPEASKVGWIKSLLLSMYYNDILAIRVVVDALTHSITNERARILERFRNRFGVDKQADLVPYWHEMMAFWPVPVSDHDEASLRLRLALFHDLVSRRLPEAVFSKRDYRRVEPAGAISFQQPSEFARKPFPDDAEVANSETAMCFETRSEPQYLTKSDIREIVKKASFFVQHYGKLFNAAFEVRPSFFGKPSEAEAVRLIAGFSDELARQAHTGKHGREEPFASVTLLERDENGVVGRIVAYVPRSGSHAHDGHIGDEAFARWADDWRRDLGIYAGNHGVQHSFAPQGERAAILFHWDKVLHLCAGVSGAEAEEDQQSRTQRPILELLRIPRKDWRQPAPLHHSLLLYSALLQPEAIARASRNKMEPLSAYDARAWRSIRSGWELEEYRERCATAAEREKQLSKVGQLWAHDEGKKAAEIDKLLRAWPDRPEQRPRRGRGWWSSAGV